MKTILLSAGLMVLSFGAFSQAQCPTNFTRNNGNTAGSCASHIKLAFAACPTTTPTLDSIKINGVLQPETFTIFEQKCKGSNIFIDYCISDDNLPPAAQLTIFLTYPDGSIAGGFQSIVCNVPESGPSGGALPIILSGFTAQRNSKNNVDLSWQTDQEINSSSFEIERSYNNVSFEKIATVAAAGNSGILRSYSFADISNDSKTTSLYRIKMVDKDGSFSYSAIKSVKGTDGAAEILVYPNPGYANSKVTISQVSGPAIIKLLDLSGRVVKSMSLDNSNSLELAGLVKGTYFLQVTEKKSGVTQVKKLTIIN